MHSPVIQLLPLLRPPPGSRDLRLWPCSYGTSFGRLLRPFSPLPPEIKVRARDFRGIATSMPLVPFGPLPPGIGALEAALGAL